MKKDLAAVATLTVDANALVQAVVVGRRMSGKTATRYNFRYTDQKSIQY